MTKKTLTYTTIVLVFILYSAILAPPVQVGAQEECCLPEFSPNGVSRTGYPGDTGTLLTNVTVTVNQECFQEGGDIELTSLQKRFIGTAPAQGSINLTVSPSGSQHIKYAGDSVSFSIMMELSSDIAPGIYKFITSVSSSCIGDHGGQYSDSAESETFTLTVLSSETAQCCQPVLGAQLNTTVVPGDRVALASLSISNNCFFGSAEFQSQPVVTVNDLDIFPDPGSGTIFLLLAPQQLTLETGDTGAMTLFAVVTEDVPTGFYQIDVTLGVVCELPNASQSHELTGSFTISVQTERKRSFIPGLTIPSSFSRGTCAAPGSTVLIPISTIQNPEDFKWEGVVDFDHGDKQSKLIAASRGAVMTVIPPGLKGETLLRVRGPEGQSNTVTINIDETCSSNQGNEVTEKQVEKWGSQVPEDLMERATDQTGQYISFVPGEILIQFNGEADGLANLKAKYGIVSFERIPPTNFYVARLEDRGIRNTLETADRLSTEEGVTYATENGLMSLIQDEPELNDPNINEQEQLKATNIFTGWKVFFPIKGQGIKIAVVDTGLDLAVRDEVRTTRFAPNGVDVSSGHQNLSLLLGTSTADDRRGHGTIVSGIAAARGDNRKLGVGIAFNSRVLPIKVFGRSRFTPQDIIAKGLIAAFYLEADVINMSLGCSRCRPSKERQTRKYFANVLDFLFEDFNERGVVKPIVVAATGNDGEGIVDTPAADPRVIAIGSYNLQAGEKSSFSNYGEEVDFVAPGENIFTTLIGGKFGDAGSGTSFSSPQGAGLVALILSTQPKLKELGVEAVKEKIKSCFVKDVGEPGFDQETGWGLIYIPDPEEVDPERCLTFEGPGDEGK
ncbi:S8 family serine peptidase [Candidatus Bipolaricaulota bacterium]|nr:S8 family serine peptidase [Candidatus Bipolaricaulota bacterium]